jgi:hypothetical protein
MPLPTINFTIRNDIWGFPVSGNLIYKYSPFQNLQNLDVESGEDGLKDLRLTSTQANISTSNPLVLNIEKAYDGSANLIISDKVNPPKIVNSRFYLTSSDEFAIADRKGNMDTNVYTEANFPIETGLIKTVRSVVNLDFEGVEDGGILPVGNLNFYFKLADYDGNESDFIAESGQVVCYIGSVNNPTSIRGGQLNEISNKLVKFKLSNLDLAYDYINVYYTRSTGDNLTDNITAYKITNKFRILGSSTKISITGYEETEEITLSDINIQYANFDSTKTITSCQNIVFAGNITKDYTLYTLLEKYSLLVVPTLTHEEDIGNLTSGYSDLGENANEYYNPNNIYYRLGYWDEEIYRLGIVYILNNYTLSPVFNIRGKKEINLYTGNPFYNSIEFSDIQITEEINSDDNYIITGTDIQPALSLNENTMGVFKINSNGTSGSNNNIFNNSDKIRPIGVKLCFHNSIIDGTGVDYPPINQITKGFFIVRQKRIPNILAQGLSIGTSIKGHIPTIKASSTVGGMYVLESFLKNQDGIPILERDIYGLTDSEVTCNALLCPEANLRSSIYGSLFNASSFVLKANKYIPDYRDKFYKTDEYDKIFTLSNLGKNINIGSFPDINTELLLVNPNTTLINNKDTLFSSVAGNENEAWKHTDPINGDIEELTNPTTVDTDIDKDLSRNFQKTRGIFNSYVGSSKTLQAPSMYYDIYNKNYNFEDKWKDYFNIRYNDSSPFFPISDRMSWSQIDDTLSCYRGDCYINTYTHRMMWNFIDPELPTNKRIVDKYTWFKNYKVKTIKVKASNTDFVVEDTSEQYGSASTNFLYRKVLPVFTYKSNGTMVDDIDTGTGIDTLTILTPEAKKYKKYSESNGEFGFNKINRPDINAVGLGHWVTFKICSNINLALRDEDFSNPGEEALHKRKRSFYPYSSADQYNKLPESNIINTGISKSLGNKSYFEIPDVPFIQTYFNNRIYASNLLIESIFRDGSRIFKSDNYQDYTMEHGQLIKLVEWYGKLIAVMEHGILMIPVNERAMMTNATGDNVYINTDTVLPKNPRIISNTFGSVWSESIIKTSTHIYGIDTIGKKIWRTDGENLEIISDMKVQKFLNDNIQLKVTDKNESVSYNLIKSHYNAFKRDVIFTYKYGTTQWSLCWNEILNKWITRYTWFPEFSENINNIFYTFAYVENEFENLETSENYASKGKLFKHGFAGTLEQQNNMKPTVWYETQHPFEFEFVVIEIQGVQKIFDNLKIISNKAEPNSFTFEVVGEGYDWYKYKEVLSWMENHSAFNDGEQSEDLEFIITEDGYYSIENTSSNYYSGYTYLLSNTIAKIELDYPDFPTPYGMSGTNKFVKLPYIPKIKQVTPLDEVDWETLNYNVVLIDDDWNGEDRVLSYQEGKSMTKYGRLHGNMHYVEDSWDIQIQPVKFRYAFMKSNTLTFTSLTEMKVRDKYMKVRVKYDGTKLAIINAIKTLFTLSHA